MKAKIIQTALVLSIFLVISASVQAIVTQDITQNANQVASASSGANIGQNIIQNANQQAFGVNNTTVNQTLNQRARQAAIGTGNINQMIGQTGNQYAAGGNVNQNINQTGSQYAAGGNVNQGISQTGNQRATGSNINQGIGQTGNQYATGSNVSQGIGQTGNQYAAGSNINQNIYQNANQTAVWNVQNYFNMPQSAEISSDQRSVIVSREENFLALYPESRAFIMPVYDFQTIVNQASGQIIVLDVSAQGTVVIPAGFNNIIRIPLANLISNIESIPANAAVAVISDNDINSAVAMTLLRMNGYNAWVLPVGVCGLQGTATTGTAISSGLTTQSQTVNGVTTGQTTGTVSRTTY